VVHDAAADGYERQAETYERARPDYHPELIARLVALVGTGTIIDLGAGTGILTADLARAGCGVIAVEPVAAMRERFNASHPHLTVLDGTAESIPMATSSADVVVVGQAFHWFDATAALHEISRVLKPGGLLITVWNVRDEDVPWMARYTEVMDRYAGDAPRYRTFEWRAAIDSDRRFNFVDEWHIDNPTPTDTDGVIGRALSTSFIAALDPTEQDEVIEEITGIVEPLGPTFDFPYRSEMQVWRLVPVDQLTLG
jgi:SAM-dependent methyltransferase